MYLRTLDIYLLIILEYYKRWALTKSKKITSHKAICNLKIKDIRV